MDRRDVEAQLIAAETRRREAQSRLEENAERLAQLEDERNKLLGASAIAKQGVADFDERVEQLREQLHAVEADEARTALATAVRLRDTALARGAEAIESLLAAIEQLAAARTTVAEAHRQLLTIDGRAPKQLPSEPSEYDEQWSALGPLVEAELGVRLDSELVEAAIRNPNPHVIDQLPEHLRDLARQRKRDLQRELLRRRQAHTGA